MLGRRARLALLVAAPLLAYASALGNGFVWDDHQTIERGLYIDSLANLPRLFAHDTMWNSDGGRFAAKARIDTYRPLTMSSYFVERALFGKRPFAYHLDSVLVHLACVLLLYGLARRLLGDGSGPFLGALCFALHPAISEGVHWVNGRSDPLCALFFLAALRVWTAPPEGDRRSLRRDAAVAALVLASTLCKETGFLLAPLALLLVGRLGLRGRAAARALLPWLAGVALGLAARLAALGRGGVGAGSAQIGYALLRLPLLLAQALKVLVLPEAVMEPSLAEHYRVISFAAVALAVALWAALATLGLWRRRHGDPFLGVALAGLGLSLAPVALLTVVPDWSGWGRYLYPSAPLFGLALAEAASRLEARFSSLPRAVGRASIAALALLLAGETFAAGAAWRDDRALYRAQIAEHPEIARGWFELGFLEYAEGHPDEARPLLSRAVDLAPREMPFPWSHAAVALWRLGDQARARTVAERALRRDPNDADARNIQRGLPPAGGRWSGENPGR